MRFLIVGASGFIGSHILSYVRGMGHEALGTRCVSDRSDLVAYDLLKDRIKDCVNASFFEMDEPVYTVICAALSQIDRCKLERELSYRINVENTLQMIRDLRELGSKVVFLSTSAVYDGHLGYYNEDSPHNPICEYGRHKEVVEQFLLKETPEAFILRLDKVVADDPTGNHLFRGWYQDILENRPIVCIDQLFSPTYVKDVARAIVLGCEIGIPGAHNVANPEFFTRVQLARQFTAQVGSGTELIEKAQEEFDFADPRLTYSYMDSSKFRKETGMQFTSMREVMRSFLSNVRQMRG